MIHKNESKILEMYHLGYSVLEMANKLGCTRQYIYNSLKYCVLSIKDRDSEKTDVIFLKENVSRLRDIWWGMKRRCLDKRSDRYKNYGMRNISIHEDWFVFANFYDWAMNNNYTQTKQIDRIDNDGNYCPENCRWVTRAENCQNTRVNVLNRTMVVAARVAKTANIMTITEMSKFLNVERTVLGNAVNKRTWKNIYP